MQEWNIPFFGVAREFAAHRDEIMERIEKTLMSGQVLQGKPVADFEHRVAALVQRKYAVAVNSCTDALYFGLLGAGIRPGDEVLVTDFSFIASASCIARLGAIPIFVDVDNTYNMDLEKACALVTPKTRGMVLVHLYGQMADPVQVEGFAREHGLILIEDAAQAFGASFNGRMAGSLGSVSCFSFDPTKPLSAPGSGGIVLTDSEAIANCIRQLRYHGKDGDGNFVEIGYNSQMPTATAAVLNFKLDHNGEWLMRRRKIARFYTEGLSRFDIVLPVEQQGVTHIYHKFVIRSAQRDALISHLKQFGIITMIHYQQPLHRQPCFAEYDYYDSYYPIALSYAQTVLSLPIHPFLTDAEVEAIVNVIKGFSHHR